MCSKWSCSKLVRHMSVDMQPKAIVSKKFTWPSWHFLLFFLSGFSFMDSDNSREKRGREGNHLYPTLPLPPAHEHSNIYFATLHVRLLSHISNRTAWIYQAATRWDLPPYRITIWLIDDVLLIFVCLLVDLIQGFWYSYLGLETRGLEHLMILTLRELIHPEISYCEINFCVYWFFGNFAVYRQIWENCLHQIFFIFPIHTNKSIQSFFWVRYLAYF